MTSAAAHAERPAAVVIHLPGSSGVQVATHLAASDRMPAAGSTAVGHALERHVAWDEDVAPHVGTIRTWHRLGERSTLA